MPPKGENKSENDVDSIDGSIMTIPSASYKSEATEPPSKAAAPSRGPESAKTVEEEVKPDSTDKLKNNAIKEPAESTQVAANEQDEQSEPKQAVDQFTQAFSALSTTSPQKKQQAIDDDVGPKSGSRDGN